jgi:hypothetical protein
MIMLKTTQEVGKLIGVPYMEILRWLCHADIPDTMLKKGRVRNWTDSEVETLVEWLKQRKRKRSALAWEAAVMRTKG